ncbi:hypothetical protein CIRG_02657 [Coccidioides immitis RMSCC 2394]|uniref:Uncharacterized protein n=1 Tax=Coccidioides immitis RMSCC 2394 TaxID=404692 RepID=A0A0J6Y5E5_COCIT|nr:hypothetical protein CIRG_02657 [Coccidioides immitis RMSCC 2394]
MSAHEHPSRISPHLLGDALISIEAIPKNPVAEPVTQGPGTGAVSSRELTSSLGGTMEGKGPPQFSSACVLKELAKRRDILRQQIDSLIEFRSNDLMWPSIFNRVTRLHRFAQLHDGDLGMGVLSEHSIQPAGRLHTTKLREQSSICKREHAAKAGRSRAESRFDRSYLLKSFSLCKNGSREISTGRGSIGNEPKVNLKGELLQGIAAYYARAAVSRVAFCHTV